MRPILWHLVEHLLDARGLPWLWRQMAKHAMQCLWAVVAPRSLVSLSRPGRPGRKERQGRQEDGRLTACARAGSSVGDA